MERITHGNLVQGSSEWLAHRRNYDNASEAKTAMGLDPKTPRNEFIRLLATGDEKEYSRYVKEVIFANGHRIEELARPIAEEFLGETLYPGVYSRGQRSCSLDGMNISEEINWECKQWNEALAESVRNGIVPDEHQPQCQQGIEITGATRCLFTVSDGTPEKTIHTWVEANESWFARINGSWDQLHEDVDNYQHIETKAEAVGKAPSSLLPLQIEVSGQVTASNLNEFRQQAMEVIGNINTDLRTDEEFADAKTTVKWLKQVEEKLVAAKELALDNTASIRTLFDTMDDIAAEARKTRLNLNNNVTDRDIARKAEIIKGGSDAFAEHISGLNTRLGNAYMPVVNADFAGVCHGLKTLSSRQNKVDTELARVKIESNAIADKIHLNVNSLKELASDHKGLFPDTRVLVLKDNDDLVAVIKSRIADHKQQESDRAAELVAKIQAEADKKAAEQLEADREKIRAEEEAKATAKAEAEAKAVRESEEAARVEAQRKLDNEAVTNKKNEELQERVFGSGKSKITIGHVMPAAEPEETLDTAEHPYTPEELDLDKIEADIIEDLREHGIGKPTCKKVAAILASGGVRHVTLTND